ncbi:MAG: Holliday junction branch migration protein RuvA, partial [Tannerellaceae bacterium]
MIEYIKGDIAEITPTDLVLETYGIGYAIHISLNTYSALNGKNNVKLYIYEVIREDTHELYGFAEKEERTVFLALISVSGVGSNTARMILSSYNPNELQTIIASEKVDALKAVKG